MKITLEIKDDSITYSVHISEQCNQQGSRKLCTDDLVLFCNVAKDLERRAADSSKEID